MPDIYKWKNNSQFFKITSITHLGEDPGEQYSYCIECNDSSNPYFTLPSGLITHNCRLRNAVKPEFSFTSGNVGVATGSKSVITLNLNRIVQNTMNEFVGLMGEEHMGDFQMYLKGTLETILERVYEYHKAYNEILKDLVKDGMMPVYSERYISLNQQFLTIGINGLNEAAEFLGMTCTDNPEYEGFCKLITSTISTQNKEHSTPELKFNTEFVPRLSGHVKSLVIDLKLLEIGQQGASNNICKLCAA